MPRTKAPKKTDTINAKTRKILEEIKEKVTIKHEMALEHIESIRSRLHEILEVEYALTKMGCSHLDKTIGEIRAMHSTTNSTSLLKKDIASTKKKRSLSCPTEDDGYLTDGSHKTSEKRVTRASRSAFKNPLANSTRIRKSRSLSRNNSCKTPISKKTPNTYGMITPKLKPNAPQILLRRPKRGEVAVSLDGSPLMINPMDGDHAANVNIPLPGGKGILSLQPERGFRASLLPVLDAETGKQLEVLKEHIEKICSYANRQNAF